MRAWRTQTGNRLVTAAETCSSRAFDCVASATTASERPGALRRACRTATGARCSRPAPRRATAAASCPRRPATWHAEALHAGCRLRGRGRDGARPRHAGTDAVSVQASIAPRLRLREQHRASRGSVRSAEALVRPNSAKRLARSGLLSDRLRALYRRRSFPVLHGAAARGAAAGSMLLSASLDAVTPRSHAATWRVGAAPGLLVPGGAASRAGAAASASLRRVPGALPCAQQPRAGTFLRRAAGGDAACARRRRRSHVRGTGALSVASAAVEETGGAAAAAAESPFSGACSRAPLYGTPAPFAVGALAFRRLEGAARACEAD